MQVGELVTITPPQIIGTTHAGCERVTGVIVKIEEGDDFGDGPVNSMVSVLTSSGIIEITSKHISLKSRHAK